MGVDITSYVLLRDDGKWHMAPVKVQDKYAEDKEEWRWAQVYNGRCGELFDILCGKAYDALDSARGFFPDAPEELVELRNRFKEVDEETGHVRDYGFDDTYFTLFELNLALRDKKRYPKWDKWRDEDGIKHKDVGSGQLLRGFVDSVAAIADMCGWYDPKDVVVVMWFDW